MNRFTAGTAAAYIAYGDLPDEASSVSRQHYIDTGRYLTNAEVAEIRREEEDRLTDIIAGRTLRLQSYDRGQVGSWRVW